MLKERRLPIRYACAFPLAETDGIEDLQFYVCYVNYGQCYYSIFYFFIMAIADFSINFVFAYIVTSTACEYEKNCNTLLLLT